ncbi:MAG: hypothetical protein KGV59_04730 [Tenacibaculum sp.]|nr:hypothetical protein [Tenacibaculum sp.]
MKYFLIFFTLIFCSCNNTDEKSENVITKEDRLKTLYLTKIRPVFTANYKEVDIPTEFKIDKEDKSINAGASFGYVEVSQGLVDCKDEYIQIFTLFHEVGHIVTLSQAKKFNLGSEIPKGTTTNTYKKAEYLADLIALYLIGKNLPKQKEVIIKNFSELENLLGSGSFTHPSGKKRIELLQSYLLNKSFKTSFKSVWNMD